MNNRVLANYISKYVVCNIGNNNCKKFHYNPILVLLRPNQAGRWCNKSEAIDDGFRGVSNCFR